MNASRRRRAGQKESDQKRKGRPPRRAPLHDTDWKTPGYLAGGGVVPVPIESVVMAGAAAPVDMLSVLMVVVPVAMLSVVVVVVVSVVVVEVVAGVVSSVVSSFLQPTKLSKPTSKQAKDR